MRLLASPGTPASSGETPFEVSNRQNERLRPVVSPGTKHSEFLHQPDTEAHNRLGGMILLVLHAPVGRWITG